MLGLRHLHIKFGCNLASGFEEVENVKKFYTDDVRNMMDYTTFLTGVVKEQNLVSPNNLKIHVLPRGMISEGKSIIVRQGMVSQDRPY